MPKPSLPPSILLALGLAACKDSVGPCLDVAVEIDTDTDADADSDTDTDTDTDSDADTDIGPCLDIAPTGDSGVGPCLSPPQPTGETGAPETGTTDTGAATADTAAGSPTANRASILRTLIEQGVLPADAADRLLSED